MSKEKVNLFKRPGIQSFISSLICIILGLFIAFIVLLIINPSGAFSSIMNVIKNFFWFRNPASRLKYFGETLAKTVPLLMCALAVLFSYKVGLFNIGSPGQYCAGICASIYAALNWNWGWLPCLLFAMVAGAALASIVGVLKAYLNVNEVISGIMLNWICLYFTNAVLTPVKNPTGKDTLTIASVNKGGLIPSLGLDKLFNDKYVTIAIPLAIIIAVVIMIILEKTKFGYELRATGLNKNAAKYCGMMEKRNIIVTLVISGALAGMGAGFYYLTDFEQWAVTSSTVPGMGFNGIAATFLGGLNPIGTIFSSYFITHITAGGAFVDLTKYSSQITDLISALIIYLCGFVLFMKTFMNNVIRRREVKKTGKYENYKQDGRKN
ncbi:MAG: ABC transporter permease [Spirochaetales bacterium]|nr:ABC transporter permease [Spirochaetales bacterium]